MDWPDLSSPTRPFAVPALTTIAVVAEHDVSRARVAATSVALAIGFSREAAYRLATAISELGNNLVFHATAGGTVQITPICRGGDQGIEVVIEDSGPGIVDLAWAMTDGHSTNGGLGSGLPGSRRLVDEFEIASRPGAGTRVAVRIWK